MRDRLLLLPTEVLKRVVVLQPKSVLLNRAVQLRVRRVHRRLRSGTQRRLGPQRRSRRAALELRHDPLDRRQVVLHGVVRLASLGGRDERFELLAHDLHLERKRNEVLQHYSSVRRTKSVTLRWHRAFLGRALHFDERAQAFAFFCQLPDLLLFAPWRTARGLLAAV